MYSRIFFFFFLIFWVCVWIFLDKILINWENILHRFHYMAMADNRQRLMPLPDDREPERGQVLAYPEAVKLINPVEPEFKGEVFQFQH